MSRIGQDTVGLNFSKELKINKRFLLSLLTLVFIGFILEYYYCNFIVETYKASGFFLEFNILKYIESKLWFLLLLSYSFFINKRSQFVSALFLLMILMVFIPGEIIFSFLNGSRKAFYSILTFFAIFGAFSSLRISVKTIVLSDWIKYSFLILISFIMVIPVFLDFKLNINSSVFKLQDIYEVRDVFKSGSSVLTSYAFWWLAKVVLPTVFVFSLIRKNKLFVFISLLLLTYLFLVSGHKSVYFTPILLLFYFHVGKDYNQKILYTLILIALFLILVNIPDLIIDRPMFKSIFVRRVFFVPGLLNELYFDFFEAKPIFLSHSILSGVIDYPYEITPSYLIGATYFNKPEMSANIGIVADGFMNFGYLGVLLFSMIFSIIIMILNSIKLDVRYFGLFVFYILIFRGSALLTVILTHGFWILLIFAFVIFPKKIIK
jgi:hypothetical protein